MKKGWHKVTPSKDICVIYNLLLLWQRYNCITNYSYMYLLNQDLLPTGLGDSVAYKISAFEYQIVSLWSGHLQLFLVVLSIALMRYPSGLTSATLSGKSCPSKCTTTKSSPLKVLSPEPVPWTLGTLLVFGTTEVVGVSVSNRLLGLPESTSELLVSSSDHLLLSL